jgi:hypothetical protein
VERSAETKRREVVRRSGGRRLEASFGEAGLRWMGRGRTAARLNAACALEGIEQQLSALIPKQRLKVDGWIRGLHEKGYATSTISRGRKKV